MKKSKEEQIEYIKNNYFEYGALFCSLATGLTEKQVRGIAGYKKLKRRGKRDSDYPISCENLFEIDATKAYCLGLLWTDGCVHKNQIFLTSTEPDATFFESKMMNIGKWGISKRKDPKYPSWKERVTFQTSNPLLAQKLKELNFNDKESGFHLLYDTIPKKFKRYFWIGMIDGDGCFYIHKKKGQYSFTLCSSLNQNWNCFANLLRGLNIRFTIERAETEKGKYSKVHINGKYEIMKFGKYLYETIALDKIGLNRKYQKYLEILSKCKKEIPKFWMMSKSEIKLLKVPNED